jgi:hypothetical protein
MKLTNILLIVLIALQGYGALVSTYNARQLEIVKTDLDYTYMRLANTSALIHEMWEKGGEK